METMEARMVKLYARNNNHVALHAIPGHFATSHSHINFYIDMTSLKTRANEAQEVAKSLAGDYVNSTVVDTIVCMDGTEVVGAYLAQEFEKRGFRNTNLHDTIYVVTPEYNPNNQLIFRDNTIPAIKGKNVILLLATTTTGLTVRRSLECVQYYGGTVRGINAKGQGSMARKKIDKLVEFAKGYGAKGLAYIAIHEDGSWKSSFSKFMTEEQMEALIKAMDGQAGDLLLFAADRNKIVWNVLGALRLELAEQMGLLDKNEYRFVWITEFPLLEWSDEENRFTAMHHPFTMPMDEDLPLLDTDPGAVRAKAYDIVLNGTEIGGGSVRIHQNDVQEKMFEMLGFTKEQAHERFGFLLDAFKYGVPPHAGLAYGLDRLVMLMAKEDSIRDVIAFPKVKDASCLMTEAPSPVDAAQLEELGLEVELQAEEETTEE